MAQKLFIEIIGDSSSIEKTFRKTGQDAKKFQASIDGVGKTMTRSFVAAGAAFFSAQGLVNGLKSSVNAASDLNEQMSKSNVVFGASADQIQSWSKTTAASLGLSQRAALGVASSFGALFAPLGITGQVAADQSRRLTQLGADLASFYNTDVQDALDAIRSGIVGESEPLRRYGVLLSETRVQQEAMAETGKKTAAALTQQEKVAARLTLIFQDSAQAQGDFARTSDGFANQMRILNAQIDDLQTQLGEALLPTITDVAKRFNEWLADPENKKKIIDSWASAINSLAAAALAAASAFEKLQGVQGGLRKHGSFFGTLFDQYQSFARNVEDVKKILGLGPSDGGGGFGNIFRQTNAAFDTGGFGNIFDQILAAVAGIQGAGQTIGQADAANRTRAAIAKANSVVGDISGFINKWLTVGRKWETAQKQAAAQRARNQLARQRFAAGLENQWGWLEFGLERAQTTKTLADDRRILKKQEDWLQNRIRHAGRTLELVTKLWRVRQQIRDLNKSKAGTDPLAGLMQVSSKQLAGILAAGTGLDAYGRNILAANIAGQEIHTYVHLDGREVARSVNRTNAQTTHRTSRQTSGFRG